MSYQRHAKQHLAAIRVARFGLALAVVGALIFIGLQFVPKHAHLAHDVWDRECIVEHKTQSGPIRAIGVGDMHHAANKAANALLNLELEKFSILSDCVNPAEVVPEVARLKVAYRVLTNSGWTRSKLIEASRGAADIYAQCGIYFDDVEVTFVEVKDNYDELDWAEHIQLVAATSVGPYPHLYFVNSQDSDIKRRNVLGLAMGHGMFSKWATNNPEHFQKTTGQPARYAEEIGVGNTAMIMRHPFSKSDSGYARHTEQMGIAIAHELYHLYGDCMCHERDPANFMFASAVPGQKSITSRQCGITRNRIRNQDVLEADRLESTGESW